MKQLLLFFSVWLVHHPAIAQATTAQLDEFISAYVKQGKFNGTALVAQKGKVLLEKGYGLKNASLPAANDSNTIYQIGSVTKQFTAALILHLQEQKRLSVKDKVSEYFPDFPNGEKITIENLLTHTSGIYNYTDDSLFMANEITHSYTRDKLMALFRDKPLDFEPGTRWSYSNSGYCMLGYIIEKVTKQPYQQMMREVVFRPLHMVHSGFDFTHLKSVDKAVGYLELNDKTKRVAPIVDSSVSFSAGSLYSTVGDLYKWERAMFGNTVLKQQSWKVATTPFRDKYGYGWFIDTLYHRQVLVHGGGIHGFNSILFRMPQEEIVVILLNNKNTPALDEISKGLAAILLHQKYELPKGHTAITVSDSILRQYVGEYQLAPAFKITVKLENGRFTGQGTGQPEFDMFAEKENFFFLKAVDAQVEFVKGSDGKTEKMILYQNGLQLIGKKIK